MRMEMVVRRRKRRRIRVVSGDGCERDRREEEGYVL